MIEDIERYTIHWKDMFNGGWKHNVTWRETHGEGISYISKDGHNINLEVHETFVTNTIQNDDNIFRRVFLENIHVNDKDYKYVVKNLSEDIAIQDDIIRKPNAIVGTVIFSKDRVNNNSIVGYSEFKPFIAGDYQYQTALYKTEVKTDNSDNIGVLHKLNIYVDLPDIHDSGIETINGSGHIWFNRKYFRVPEVTITTMSSVGNSIANIVITDIQREGFTVELFDANGELTDGKIVWTSLGC